MMRLHREILSTLLYYDLWEHPLTLEEIYAFLPDEAVSREEFVQFVAREGPGPEVREHQGYYYVTKRSSDVVSKRREKEALARKRWKLARFAAHIIKRFPFVRGVFVSGDLSKNVSSPGSDIDFVVITLPNRLWISRTLLMLFKKTVLLNSRKFFCLNSYAALDSMYYSEHSIYTAMEIATLKPLYNPSLFRSYLEANGWIAEYFPNLRHSSLPSIRADSRGSIMQKLFELLFGILPLDRLETYLLEMMKRYWAQSYPQYDAEMRNRVFRSTRGESRAFVSNCQNDVLCRYQQQLKDFGIFEPEPVEAEHALLATG